MKRVVDYGKGWIGILDLASERDELIPAPVAFDNEHDSKRVADEIIAGRPPLTLHIVCHEVGPNKYEVIRGAKIIERLTESEAEVDGVLCYVSSSREELRCLVEPTHERRLRKNDTKGKDMSPQSKNRLRKKGGGMVCPFCGGAVSELKNGHRRPGYRTFACERRTHTRYYCKFMVMVPNSVAVKTINLGRQMKEHPDARCGNCGEPLYVDRISANEQSVMQVRCKKAYYREDGRFAKYEFGKGHTVKRIRDLCAAITSLGIAADMAVGDLRTLNQLLCSAKLFENYVMLSPCAPESMRELEMRVISARAEQTSVLTQEVREAIVKFNRWMVERVLPGAPRLYEDNGALCKFDVHSLEGIA